MGAGKSGGRGELLRKQPRAAPMFQTRAFAPLSRQDGLAAAASMKEHPSGMYGDSAMMYGLERGGGGGGRQVARERDARGRDCGGG